MSNPNDPAHPIHVPADSGWKSSVDRTYTGMTIRQEFVLAAMQGLCANPKMTEQTATDIARWAVEQADAALAEEAKTRGEK